MARNQIARILRYLGQLTVISAIAGTVGAILVTFLWDILDILIESLPRLLPRVPFLLPAIGALITGIFIIRWIPGAGGEGIPSYIDAVNNKGGHFRTAATILKIPATLITLGFYGSGGIVGPFARISSGAASLVIGTLIRPLKLKEAIDLRTAAICGVSGAVSAIFHAPIGGGIFAAEILRKDSMRYSDLVPSILAGMFAFFVSSSFLERNPLIALDAPAGSVSTSLIPWFVLVTVASGLIGVLFIAVFGFTSKLLGKMPYGQPARALAAAVIVCLVWFFKSGRLLNISMPLFHQITMGELSVITAQAGILELVWPSLLLVLLLKIVATSCTVGSGMSAGMTGPCIILGVGSGSLLFTILGFSGAGTSYHAFMAAGMAAMLSAVMNIPIAAMIITVKLFGQSYVIPAAIGSILSFLLFKGRYLYALTVVPPNHPGGSQSQ